MIVGANFVTALEFLKRLASVWTGLWAKFHELQPVNPPAIEVSVGWCRIVSLHGMAQSVRIRCKQYVELSNVFTPLRLLSGRVCVRASCYA